MKIQVVVMPKKSVLDPQGAAISDAMKHLGMPEVHGVRMGKFLEIEVANETPDLQARLQKLCHDLLSNPVIEDYRIETPHEPK